MTNSYRRYTIYFPPPLYLIYYFPFLLKFVVLTLLKIEATIAWLVRTCISHCLYVDFVECFCQRTFLGVFGWASSLFEYFWGGFLSARSKISKDAFVILVLLDLKLFRVEVWYTNSRSVNAVYMLVFLTPVMCMCV